MLTKCAKNMTICVKSFTKINEKNKYYLLNRFNLAHLDEEIMD